jgi:hypothetical protein
VTAETVSFPGCPLNGSRSILFELSRARKRDPLSVGSLASQAVLNRDPPLSREQHKEARHTELFGINRKSSRYLGWWCSKALSKLEVHLQYVNELLPPQAVHRRKRVLLEDLLDLLMDLRGISLYILRPFA